MSSDRVLEVLGDNTLTITQVCDALAVSDVDGERTAVRNEITTLVRAGRLVKLDNRWIRRV